MTKQLIILRHAKSDWGDASITDAERPLNERGIEAAKLTGSYMDREGLVPERILCSTATRAQRTLELVTQAWQSPPPVESVAQLYMAEPETLMSLIRSADESTRRLMIIGHNPGLAQTVYFLVHDHDPNDAARILVKFPTAGLAVIELETQPWSEVTGGRLVTFQTPKRIEQDLSR